jgi:hypothetical protein
MLGGAVEAGKLEMLATHVLDAEIAADPDPGRRARAQVLALCRDTPTGAFAVAFSKIGQAELSDAGVVAVERLRSGKLKHTKDALIASTGRSQGSVLVSQDERQRREAAAARDRRALSAGAAPAGGFRGAGLGVVGQTPRPQRDQRPAAEPGESLRTTTACGTRACPDRKPGATTRPVKQV